jgi:hypothetical protein
MGSLQEFLDEQAERIRTENSKAALMRMEWVAAVDRLMDQIKDWIAQADPKRILTIEEQTITIREERIGSYEVRALTIILGISSVRVQPIGRYVMGPLEQTQAYRPIRVYGRVDLTNGLEKYMVFRDAGGPDSRWFITNQDGYESRAFDRDALEATLQRLFG